MRIGLFSDSHGDTEALDALLSKMGYLDAVCFMGDIARDAAHLGERLSAMPNNPPLYAVRGNNDYHTALPDDLLIMLDGVKVYLTHGHKCAGEMGLAYRAMEHGAQIALCGHTHVPMCEYVHGVLLVNPGSAGNFCRGGAARASVLTLKNGLPSVSDVRL